MAHHKSAIKRIRQTKKRTERNKHQRSTLRTFVKRVREAAENKDANAAREALAAAIPVIDKSASKGIIHKANAARNVSRLTKLVNSLS
ncbi:MAG: 30S ribosomal protein S20 [Desulfuromonadales bacterium]|nr:30S ribosomal protein S20 [Desulfuromonadales bacterium]